MTSGEGKELKNMNSVFSEQILADKLFKLNNTQQCIETLSHWCIFHRSKAELVVGTWKKQFDKSEMVQRVPLLYLANDILQNSKRKGNEFVTEFWKVLPAALKDVIKKGDDHGKNVIEIWEQRSVFGSRARNLKDLMLGEDAPPPLEFGKKRLRSVRIVKRDSHSIKSKLFIGGTAEKIVSAFHLVLSEQSVEDAEMNKCKSAVQRVRKMEKIVDTVCTDAKDPKRKTLAKELEEEENLLEKCIEKLKLVEASRVALVAQLKEALHEQESELENVRTQMQVAQAQVEEACNMRKVLDNEESSERASSAKSAAAIAAEVADKLAASSSSQLIMTSVLSTFAAEEAKNAGLISESTSKQEISMASSDPHVFMSPQQLIATPNHSYPSFLVAQPPLQSAAPSSQGQYHMPGNGSIPPPPSHHQYVQSTGGIISPYGYSSIPPLPPPPPPPHVGPMLPLTHQQITQQAPTPPTFRPLQPPGMCYIGTGAGKCWKRDYHISLGRERKPTCPRF
ncbi:Regulation of nuclear pre-mRNA domain-containing protein 1B [Mucuna pruriens]|uniref:Regulation of nuclear pre-mRNA domain-containing protein 1B n=1 Tax=Mucuna pruriens TaxID=157652 RepID=A0A371F693_MUCPR|nr:Regulation of nuclear pre-mRNA domain-containing protein 1B [Mucuna pruriens]